MKSLILGAVLCLCLVSCKKNNADLSHPFEIRVTGLTQKTLVNLTALGNYGATILSQKNVSNGTYDSFINVNPGDKITITITSTTPDNANGDGEGTFKYYFNGEQMGAYGGAVMNWTETESVPVP